MTMSFLIRRFFMVLSSFKLPPVDFDRYKMSRIYYFSVWVATIRTLEQRGQASFLMAAGAPTTIVMVSFRTIG
jgi:hypothetical protein